MHDKDLVLSSQGNLDQSVDLNLSCYVIFKDMFYNKLLIIAPVWINGTAQEVKISDKLFANICDCSRVKSWDLNTAMILVGMSRVDVWLILVPVCYDAIFRLVSLFEQNQGNSSL